MKLVSKEYMKKRLEINPSELIGRACLALSTNQTMEELNAKDTRLKNGVGFSKNDARVGTLTAEQYKQFAAIADWHIKYWTKPQKNGEPKILKYTNQLNHIAICKHLKKS
jgi:hypothetical protein